MTNKYIHSLSRALWDSELISARISLFLAEMFWGIMLLWPGDTFSRGAYSNMAYLLPEDVWALVFILSATIQIYIVASNTLHNKFARIFALWNATLWMTVCSSMLLSVYPPPAAAAGDMALTAAAIWICIRPYILSEGYKNGGY